MCLLQRYTHLIWMCGSLYPKHASFWLAVVMYYVLLHLKDIKNTMQSVYRMTDTCVYIICNLLSPQCNAQQKWRSCFTVLWRAGCIRTFVMLFFESLSASEINQMVRHYENTKWGNTFRKNDYVYHTRRAALTHCLLELISYGRRHRGIKYLLILILSEPRSN